MNTNTASTRILGLVFLAAAISSCNSQRAAQQSNATEPPEPVQPLLKQVDAAQEKKRALEAQYKAMQLPELLKQLEADSAKDVEPFNSLAYREAITRGAESGKQLAAAIKGNDRSAFFTLMAVRKTNRDAYNG